MLIKDKITFQMQIMSLFNFYQLENDINAFFFFFSELWIKIWKTSRESFNSKLWRIGVNEMFL